MKLIWCVILVSVGVVVAGSGFDLIVGLGRGRFDGLEALVFAFAVVGLAILLAKNHSLCSLALTSITPAAGRTWAQLWRNLLITTAIMVPAAALFVTASFIGMWFGMSMSEKEEMQILSGVVFPWSRLWLFLFGTKYMTGPFPVAVFIFEMVPLVAYGWIWTIGRFFRLKWFLLIAAIVCLHLSAWGLAAALMGLRG